MAHIDAGKTTTTERMLYYSGTVGRLSDVDDGDTTMDFMDQERERGITITSAAISFDWRGHQINLIDTPGHVDFTVEVERSLRVLDGAVAIFDAVAGVQAQSHTVWRQADGHRIPRVSFVNKMDRAGADYWRALDTIETRLGAVPLPVHVPTAEPGQAFEAAIDVISQRVQVWVDEEGADMREMTVEAFAAEAGDAAGQRAGAALRRARALLIERLADVDDVLAEAFLGDTDPLAVDAGALYTAVRRATVERPGEFTPALCGASLRNRGVQPLMDAVVRFLPSPLDTPPVHATPVDRPDAPVRVEPEDEAPLCALAFKVQQHPHRGPLVFVRVYAGTLRARSNLVNPATGARQRAGRILLLHGGSSTEIESVGAGHIAAVAGLKDTVTGDTLVEAGAPRTHHLQLPGVAAPAPVFTASIEAERGGDGDKLEAALAVMLREDPSLLVRKDAETGQTLVSGMGELHLDIVQDRLRREHRVPVELGRMLVAYRETARVPARAAVDSEHVLGGKRMFARAGVAVAPLTDENDEVVDVPAAVRALFLDCGMTAAAEGVPEGLALGQARRYGAAVQVTGGNCVIPEVSVTTKDLPRVDGDATARLSVAQTEALQRAVEDACEGGPVGGFPLSHVAMVLDNDACGVDADSSPGALARAVRTAARKALAAAGSQLIEPMMRVTIDVPDEYIGTVLSSLTGQRRARVHHASASGTPDRPGSIGAQVPVAHMIGFATALRSMTSGEGSFTMEFDRYCRVHDTSVAEQILRGEL